MRQFDTTYPRRYNYLNCTYSHDFEQEKGNGAAMHDVIIVGAGPAGLSAAVYCARARLETLVIGRTHESRGRKAHLIDNYFGFPQGISGKDLIELGVDHATRFGASIVDGEVVAITPDDHFEVELANTEKLTARAIILATGVGSKPSGIPKEDQFVGKGVSYCATCDAFFYRNKRVAIIGSGNYAAKEALELLPHTREVTIFAQGQPFEFSRQLSDDLAATTVQLRPEKVTEFLGDGQLTHLKLESGEEWPVDGSFLALGTASSADFARTLGIQLEKGYIAVDQNGMTNFPGIFAAGDCIGPPLQIAKSVGDGCVAALSAVAWIRHQKRVQ
ncbi:MAG: NAD(P)/FAD-dependent oxidoreductase [Chloroflexi bacterium]|nr:NAD(P)/FAD-dependent oxidoreductase [Chloroflexota bacterium]